MALEPLYDAMCIGAHPDDVEIGMGATVAGMVRRGKRVVIVDLTNGEPTPHGTPERRAAESAEAARILGAERRTLSGSARSPRFIVSPCASRPMISSLTSVLAFTR